MTITKRLGKMVKSAREYTANVKKARVTVKVYLDGRPHAAPIVAVETTMTNDLPADNVGEIVCQAINKAWKDGHDPVNFSVVISFS